MKEKLLRIPSKAMKTWVRFLPVFLLLLQAANTRAQITESFEDEGTAVLQSSTNYIQNFSQNGINFATQGKMVVFGNTGSAWGADNSYFYLHSHNGPGLTSAQGIGGFTITTPATSFQISSFAAYIASDNSGNNPTNGTVTFIANLASGGTASENVTINTTSTGSGYDLSNSFSGPLNAQITSLTIMLPPGIEYIDMDNIVFTTAPIVSSQYSINNVSMAEGNSGTKSFVFTISRTQNSTTGSITATTANGSATAGEDYVTKSEVLNFGVGESSKTFSVTVNGDVTPEPDEIFSVQLSSAVNGVILNGTGVGTIKDDDSITETFETETNNSKNFSENGFEFSATGSLLISPNGGSGSGKTLDTRIGNGGTPGMVGSFGITTLATSFNMLSIEIFLSADDGVTAAAGGVTFTGTKADGSGTVTHTATFAPSGNNFTLVNFTGTPFQFTQLTSVSMSLSGGLNYLALDNLKFGTGTVVMNQVSISDVTVTEGTGPGNTNMDFILTRSNNTSSFSVDVAMAHVTTNNSDFLSTFAPTTVNFTAGGALTQSVSIPVSRDNTPEPNESFQMTLSNATNGVAILDGLGIGTINDDDAIIETFELEANNGTSFSQNGISFVSSGQLKVRNASGLGSGPSNFFLDTGIQDGPTPLGSAGATTISTANTGFKLISIDLWTSMGDGAIGSQSAAVIRLRGTKPDGSTLETDKNINPTGDMPGGWVRNIAFTGTPLDGVVLKSLELIIISGANYVALDNFSYATANTDPEIEIVNAANEVIPHGTTTASVASDTDFGSACINGAPVAKTYTIKNLATLGTLNLNGSPAVTISGSGAAHFSVTTQPSTSVGQGQSTSFVIQFTPASSGVHSAEVSIANNDLDENPYTFVVQGTVNTLPSAVITGATQVCQTAELPLSVPSAGTGATYSWSGNGLTSSNSNEVVARPTVVGAQIYQVTVSGANGCQATSTHSVNVNVAEIPTAAASVIQNVSNGSLFANSCSFLANIVPQGPNPVSGNVKVNVWVQSQPIQGLVARHYEITPETAPETSTAAVTLYFTQAEFDAYNQTILMDFLPDAPASSTINVQIVRFPGVSNPNDGLPLHYNSGDATFIIPDNVIWNATLNHWEVSFQVNSGFSGFFVKSASQAMPVTLISFQGKALGSGENQLNWVTADEKLFSHFEVLRSADGRSFEKIGHVEAAKAQSTQLKAYRFNDNNPQGQPYYRLKMVDLDGSFDLSEIISIRNRTGLSVVGSFYPNPVLQSGTGKIDIYADRAGVWKIRVFDAAGREIHTENQTLSTGLNSIKIDRLGKGLNLVHFSNGDETMVRKVIRD